jgi:hypothetical protein
VKEVVVRSGFSKRVCHDHSEEVTEVHEQQTGPERAYGREKIRKEGHDVVKVGQFETALPAEPLLTFFSGVSFREKCHRSSSLLFWSRSNSRRGRDS